MLDRDTAVVQSSDEEESSPDEEETSWDEEEAAHSPPLITWKHLWSMDQTSNALTESPFDRIPAEILIKIFRLLSVDDLANVSLVCRSFKMIADQDEIWQLKCNSE